MRFSPALCACGVAAGLLCAPALSAKTTAPPRAAAGAHHADFKRARPPGDVRRLADWVVDARDNQGLAFVILDKPRARVYAFDPQGRLRGNAPALLGLARGDDSVPGIGERKIADIRPEERTTPAGRFVAEPGRNANGEDIIWVDYDAAVSMHRVRTTNPAEHRLQRLATPSIADNRISYGCINLPVAFYEKVVSPAFKGGRGIVYVMPDVKPLRQVFSRLYDVDDRTRRMASAGASNAQALRAPASR